MKLSEIKKHLKELDTITFQLPNGNLVPNHFHVTEVGIISKEFIDCGGKVRHERVINFQLWQANDYNHRLHPEKLIHIIQLSEKKFNFDDLEIEVEYQGGVTIDKFGLDFNGANFLLTPKLTACLALDACDIPIQKPRVRISDSSNVTNCDQRSGCC